MIKNIRDDEEKGFIFKIEKKLLFNWEEVVNSLIKKIFVTDIGIRYGDIPVDFSLTFSFFGGLWIVTNVFYRFKHFYNFQDFSFTKYESLEIKTMITNFIKDLLDKHEQHTY
jgi:hypothetical protein